MLYLVIAILFGSLFAILFKIFQRKGVDSLQAIGVNYAVALLLGMAGNAVIGEPHVAMEPWIVPALLAGLFMMGSFVTMNSATRTHGIAIATIAARVALVVPVLCAYFFLRGEEPQLIATALVIVALFLLFPAGERQRKSSRAEWVHPLLVFLCYGLANFMLKLSQQRVLDTGGGDSDLSLVTCVAFAAALIFTLGYYVMRPRNERKPFAWHNMWAGVVLGVVNMGCTYFLLKSLMVVPGGVFYPVYNIAIVTIATLVGRWGFGERLRGVQYAGVVVALLSILLFFC